MAKPVKPAKKKKSGNLLVHVVILLLLATVGWRLYALQGQVRAAQAERDQYARQVENVQQENETLRSDIAEGPKPAAGAGKAGKKTERRRPDLPAG